MIPHYAFKHISKTINARPKRSVECGGPDGLTKAKKAQEREKTPGKWREKDRHTGKIARGEKEETSVGEGESDFSR